MKIKAKICVSAGKREIHIEKGGNSEKIQSIMVVEDQTPKRRAGPDYQVILPFA